MYGYPIVTGIDRGQNVAHGSDIQVQLVRDVSVNVQLRRLATFREIFIDVFFEKLGQFNVSAEFLQPAKISSAIGVSWHSNWMYGHVSG